MASPSQHNHPEPEAVRSYFRGIFQRQYYTESGPLARRLETEIGQRLGVEHVICVSNPSVAWLMLLEAVDLASGRLLLPANAPIQLREALRWIDRPHQVYDVTSAQNYRPHNTDAEACMDNGVSALATINPWGGACDLSGLSELAKERHIPLLIDSSESFGCRMDGRSIGSFGSAEVFSFNSENLINGAGSACICTQDENLATYLRCMRSSAGTARQVPVKKTVNGRMSEAQAAFALMGLERIDHWIDRNKQQHDLYFDRLSLLPGLHFLSANGVFLSNYQQAVITLESNSTRNILLSQLQGLGHSVKPLDYGWNDNAIRNLTGISGLNAIGLQLPLGSGSDFESIESICDTIADLLTCMTLNKTPSPTTLVSVKLE